METLCSLKLGQKGTVIQLNNRGGIRRRLQDMGFIEGIQVECVGKSPLGDPSAYLIMGAVIAIRQQEAGQIMISRKE